MHSLLFLCLGLVITVSMLVMISQRLKISYPIFLVLGGLAISFVPGVPAIKIDPELIFLIFLPPLLFDAAWNTSWKEFWRWRRIITVFAFGLVIVTSCVVAFVSDALIPGFTLSLGFLLGGIISPPDAVAATSVLKGVNVPRRAISILEGESLINDASSLIIFRFAVVAVITGSFVWHEAVVDFSMVTLLGIGVGVVIAMIFYAIFRWLPTTPSIDTALTLSAPYFMYLTAEVMHVSGVMAVVSGGLFMSYRSHQMFSHSTRLQATSLWSTIVFILNGLVFMLIGLELPVILEGLGEYSLGEAIGYSLIITLVIIVTRIGFTMFSVVFTMFISRFIKTADNNPGWRGPLIVGWAGMRGVVSLASALSVPLLLNNGSPFPHRNLILFITFVVILVTLVAQGLTFPLIIKWVNYQDPDQIKPEREQLREIHRQLLEASLNTLQEKYAEPLEHNELVMNLRARFEKELHLRTLHADGSTLTQEEKENIRLYHKIFSEIIHLQRAQLEKLRHQQEFSDEVIRAVETLIDLDEERLSHQPEEFADKTD